MQRGSFTREVHGAGTLVPEDLRWIPATTSGRVEEIVLQAGAEVRPGHCDHAAQQPRPREQTKSAELDWKASQASSRTKGR